MMFFATLKAKLIAGLGGILALGAIIFGAFLRGRKSKADEVQAKTAETIIKTVKKGKAIETVNRNSGSDARRERLRKYSSDSK